MGDPEEEERVANTSREVGSRATIRLAFIRYVTTRHTASLLLDPASCHLCTIQLLLLFN
jgi:hypothetical protein